MAFQWKYFELALPPPLPGAIPQVLNVGADDDPLHFGEDAVHVDVSDRHADKHKWFVHCDAHDMSAKIVDRAFDTVICGDVMEHVADPLKVALECARVARRRVILTIFEEWRLAPGQVGQFIERGEASWTEQGNKSEDYYPGKTHVNQFSDGDIANLCKHIEAMGFKRLEGLKVPEAVQDGHQWFNWLLAFERLPVRRTE
jgi:SAM-dependent methyltransferase